MSEPDARRGPTGRTAVGQAPFNAGSVRLVIFLVCAGTYASGGVALELGVLAPVLKNGTALEKPDPQGRPAPVVTRLRSGELYDQLQKEATEGFTSVVLALDVAAQRAAGAALPEPTWLYLSNEDGGFARRGFWLNEGRKQRYVPDPFVDLVVDAGSVRDGSFEEIFAHEMGHVFLRRLLPTLPHGYSRTAHSSFSITDDPTAFDEGFAIHFQGLVRRLTRNPSLRDQDLGLEYKPLVPYWLSNLDRATRVDGMRRNWFVQAQITLPGAGEALARRDQSTLFDTARLKNGNQMLASEGVIATLFYRWLVPGSPERAAILERYSRLFATLSVMKGQELAPDSPVFLDAVERFCQLFPEEAARVMALVVDTTYGATADASLIVPIEELAARGRFGDMKGFVSELQASRASLVQLRAAVLQSPKRLRAALGPALWLWSGRRAVNLNTAELEELLELPGVDRASAERALDSRRREGTFRDLADFGLRAGLSAASVARFKQMAEAMQREGTYFRR